MAYAIDLFCGAGGCSEGLIQAGFHILFSSDISEMVEVTYKHRHEQLGLIQGKNTWFERSDIKDLTGKIIEERIAALEIFKNAPVPEIDLMIGGPSCQGFSRAGRRDNLIIVRSCRYNISFLFHLGCSTAFCCRRGSYDFSEQICKSL